MNIITKKFIYFFILIVLYQPFFCMSMGIESINDDPEEQPLISKGASNNINYCYKIMRRGSLALALLTIEAVAIGLPMYFGMQQTQTVNQLAYKDICCPLIYKQPCPNPFPTGYSCINLTS